jgi:uncharacterized protein (TIGR02588 family)
LTQAQQPSDGIPMLEWIIGAFGLLLVTSVITFLVYHAITENNEPPRIGLRVHSIVNTGNGYLVKITAVNDGGSTAEGVVVEGELSSGGQPVERSHTTIDYLPFRSENQVGLFFTQDPRRFELKIRPLGYEEP